MGTPPDQPSTASDGMPPLPALSRRDFLGATAAVLAMGACAPLRAGAGGQLPAAGRMTHLDATQPGGIDLYIERQPLAIAGGIGRAITINGSVPGPVIHMREGEEVEIRVHNRMSESTSIHWHGILLPFDMDGVPGISFPGIPAGSTFTYRYRVRQSGTYWYHAHTGLQEQLGHYGQLIIEPREPEPQPYDREHTVVLSDWTFEDPNAVLEHLETFEGYYNFQRPTVANLDDEMQATDSSLNEVLLRRLRWQGMRMDPTDIADVTGATYTYLMKSQRG